MPLAELRQIAVGQTLLGVFWGIWFAELSTAVVQAKSATDVPTDVARSAYVLIAIAVVIALTPLFWILRRTLDTLSEPPAGSDVSPRLEGARLGIWLVLSLATIIIIVAGLPIAAYISFEDISEYQVALAATVIPVWLIFVTISCVRAILKERN